MRTPHFLRLAQIDEVRFISGCRSGVVHLTWNRTTIRFAADEFRRLADLLSMACQSDPPSSLWDGNLHVTCRLEEDCELRLGSLVLLLSPDELQELGQATREAVQRLDEIAASGVWDEPEEERPSANPFDLLGRPSFSQN
jgi:hypothetical protein